jgi:hypothetical protein
LAKAVRSGASAQQRRVSDNYDILLGTKTKVIRPNRILRTEDPPWKAIVFKDRIRIIKFPLTWEQAKTIRDKAKEAGLSAAITHRLHGNFAPKGQGQPGQLWCGYCRDWRFFKVLKSDPIFGPQAIPVCAYCLISVTNRWIAHWNGTISSRRRSRASIRRNRLRRRK